MEKRVWEWEGKPPWQELAERAEVVIRRVQHEHAKTNNLNSLIHAGTWDFAEEFELPIRKLLLETRRDLIRSIFSEEAQSQGRHFYMIEILFDCQKAIDEIELKIAKKNHPQT